MGFFRWFSLGFVLYCQPCLLLLQMFDWTAQLVLRWRDSRI
jgi:hypothetical protein